VTIRVASYGTLEHVPLGFQQQVPRSLWDRGTCRPIFAPGTNDTSVPHYLITQVKSSCLYSTRDNRISSVTKCFSFRGTKSPDLLPGLCPWTPLRPSAMSPNHGNRSTPMSNGLIFSLNFRAELTQVVLEKKPLNGCVFIAAQHKV